MKKFIALSLSFICCSCATVKTINPDSNHVVIQHQGKKSYCEEIPRVYSGTSYNFCLLYGEPSRHTNLGDSFNGVPFFIFDSVFSVVADTVVLPYTIPTQATEGNIKVNRQGIGNT